jgi:ribonuclease HI
MSGFPLASPVPSLTLFTDASLLGWGGYLEGQTVSGMWSSTLQKDHINLLEIRAVLLALSHFKLCLEPLSIVLATDNTTVVAYMENQGGTHCYSLYQLAKDVLILCSQFQIHLVVRHIPSRLTVLVDSLSRSLAPVNTEWELHQAVFQSIVLHWGNPNIDLFATSLNFKVTTFVSPVPDPRAVDAMSLSWEGMFAYAFPPFRFLAPVLHKITGEKCRIIVIASAWPKQAWFANTNVYCVCPVPGH